MMPTKITTTIMDLISPWQRTCNAALPPFSKNVVAAVLSSMFFLTAVGGWHPLMK